MTREIKGISHYQRMFPGQEISIITEHPDKSVTIYFTDGKRVDLNPRGAKDSR